jgi:hypothetical protein
LLPLLLLPLPLLLLFYCMLLLPLRLLQMHVAETKGMLDEASKVDDVLGFLTPILKGFLTEKGIEAATLGVQLYGGHGYIKSNKQEQNLRDVRISAIWEGTTGIQALDLLGRKIFRPKANLKPIKDHCARLRKLSLPLFNPLGSTASSHPQVRSHAKTLYYMSFEWLYLTYKIGMKAQKDKNCVGIASVDYLMYSGYITLAEHWLKMESVAAEKLKDPACSPGTFIAAFDFESFCIMSKTSVLPRGQIVLRCKAKNSRLYV